jgi:FKBP-type peptidyl-prolyl cis-trans isomerase (trigger factor)
MKPSFTLSLKTSRRAALPDLNDELAQSQGEYENLEALREDIRKTVGRA